MGNIIWLMFCCLFLSGLYFIVVCDVLEWIKPKRDFKELSKDLLKEGEYMDRDLIDIYALLQEGKNDEALESLINYVVKNK